MNHIENLFPKAGGVSNKKEKDSKNDSANNQKWAIVSIASIPLVMTLGNSMLISFACHGKEDGHFCLPIEPDHNRLFNSSDIFNPVSRVFI